ncbi:hypothetical protein HN695_00960 [Candidatus Woesearchaeota archaeon]|jgi:hypothetical protein|nr:hypothetical protein [Candidatus Woesearchaeota archaeon]MBT5272757.1 hypothetical protein [Candidatus Woesearchaeota archaeon]MBT6040369.1 hypothetical protein [Candidatus Woesearchaeota archaeon]MBT6336998.1 hypothetical protein [Candidatus Woesearchaeota archaeon]MBT7926884.1 hypothetical protein [Candidatus Woesearchaeota archaeon]
MNEIQYSGISDLNEEERDTLNEISSKSYEKIKNLLKKDDTTVSVHIKTYRQKGEKKKYSVTVKALAPATSIFRSGTTNWIFANALNDAFDRVQNEIKNHFKM